MKIWKFMIVMCLCSGFPRGIAEAAEPKPVLQDAAKTDVAPKKMDDKKAPSMDKVRWTEAKISSDLHLEYNFVGGDLKEHYTDVRYTFTRRTLLAFLLNGGLEWQRYGFDGREGALIPSQLESWNTLLALDFQWSKKHMVRVQSRPGFYSDFPSLDMTDFNAPVDFAYTGIPSKRFQWAVGVSINTWRKYQVLPGGGFRYYPNQRWKIKFMLPQPRVEYRALDNLHIYMGADFRGDSFRLPGDFGTTHNLPDLNNALVDYSETRVGPGVSWNIIPLVALNVQAGVVTQRKFEYHNNAMATTRGKAAPYVNMNIHWLFKLAPPEKIDLDIQSGRFETPVFQKMLKFL